MFGAGVCDSGELEIVPVLEDQFSFESGLQGWSVLVSDLGMPPAEWSVTQSADQAASGAGALRIQLAPQGVGPRVMLQRPFDLEPDTEYDLQLTFQTGTEEVAATAWSLLGDADPIPWDDASGLPTLGPLTATGSSGTVTWGEQSATLGVRTRSDSGRIWVAFGLLATSAEARTYWIDDLKVTVRRR